MNARILDGRILAQALKEALKREAADLKKQTGMTPRLVNVMIGDDHGACAYAKAQKTAADYIGIQYELAVLPADVSQGDFIHRIKQFNDDAGINGIMIHKPIPLRINYGVIANQVDTGKDLEGINATNIGRMMLGETTIIPCTPASVMEHLRSTKINLRGQEAVVVGHSDIVGKPLSLLLLAQHATVTVCHIATSEAGRLRNHVARADILVVAVGKPALIKGSWVKLGAIVVDVGINRIGDKIVGDVEFDSAKKRAAYITPVPGGVGPLTAVMLMRNGLEAFKAQVNARGKIKA